MPSPPPPPGTRRYCAPGKLLKKSAPPGRPPAGAVALLLWLFLWGVVGIQGCSGLPPGVGGKFASARRPPPALLGLGLAGMKGLAGSPPGATGKLAFARRPSAGATALLLLLLLAMALGLGLVPAAGTLCAARLLAFLCPAMLPPGTPGKFASVRRPPAALLVLLFAPCPPAARSVRGGRGGAGPGGNGRLRLFPLLGVATTP